jgi:hypothetical protein
VAVRLAELGHTPFDISQQGGIVRRSSHRNIFLVYSSYAAKMTALLPALLSKFTFTNAALAIVAYILYSILYQIVYYRFFHPLSKFPGPFWASVTRLWVAYHNIKEDERFVEYDLHKKYGIKSSATTEVLFLNTDFVTT